MTYFMADDIFVAILRMNSQIRWRKKSNEYLYYIERFVIIVPSGAFNRARKPLEGLWPEAKPKSMNSRFFFLPFPLFSR